MSLPESSDDSPPLKRKRGDEDLEGPTQTSDATVLRGDVWFEDGNILLVAEDFSFKVHQGVLSHNSDIFRDMFELPQPSNLEVQDGVQVVHLSDPSEDVTHMLSALYKGHLYVAIF